MREDSERVADCFGIDNLVLVANSGDDEFRLQEAADGEDPELERPVGIRL